MAAVFVSALAQAEQAASSNAYTSETVPRSSLQLELASVQVPSPDRANASNTDSHVTLTGWSALAPQAAGVGFGVDVVAPISRPVGDAQASIPSGSAGLDLGLRWRSSRDLQGGRMHVSIWQRVTSTPDAISLVQQLNGHANNSAETRLEMQFSAASARGIHFELGGALGMQLNSGGDKVVLRVSHGRPMVYYRAKF